ncbi:MAG: class I SAM-dependent rRNA methyltransferase [Gemmatimonadetes bacterium]|nr:class I SAM-dependent rRNA methyltransferase [Gemmatimonadota bacterium]
MSERLPAVVLAPGRDHPARARHPWVFSGAVARVEGSPEDGAEVDLLAADGTFIARGLFNSKSQIRVRLYSWDAAERIDEALFARRIDGALALRASLDLMTPHGGCRLVFSEGDGLSGLVVDRYRDILSMQLTSLALGLRRELLLDLLEERLRPAGVLLRTEKGVLEEEGLEARDGLLRGTAPDEPIPVVENGLTFLVDLRTGQKTGYFLDQRDNRVAVARYAQGRRIADVFCYTGGFTLPCLRAGAASVVGVDMSATAVGLAAANAGANGLDDGRVRFETSDAFKWLDGRAAAGERFDLIVLDPPRFARSSRGVPSAVKGYRRLNEIAVRCLEPGGILVTCSCTGRVTREMFEGVLAEVEVATGRRIRILENRGQAGDHPVSPTCPETAYLKCLVCGVE